MIRHHTVTGMAILALCAASLPAQKDDGKKVFKAQARTLLDPAIDMVPAVNPELHGVLLRDIGSLYGLLDKKKSAKILTDGFQAALAVAEPERSRQQGRVIQAMTEIDVALALQHLAQLPPTAGEGRVKPEAYERVVRSLVAEGKLDRALEALQAYGAGEYPFQAATSLMEKLDKDDGRRLILFGSATAAYQATPRGDFGGMITKTHASLPAATVQPALAVIVNALLEPKGEKADRAYTSIATEKGSASFGSDEELELFKLFKVLNALDPKKAAEVLEKKPALRDALAKLPEGVEKGKGSVRMTKSGSSEGDRAGEAQAEKTVAEMELVNRVSAAAEKNLREGIDMAGKLKDANLRGGALARIAAMAAEKEPETAEAAITKAMGVLEEMKDALGSSMALLELLGAAHEAKKPALTRQLLEKGFALVERLSSEDRHAEKGNRSPRDVWPSTQVARLMMNAAGEIEGPEAIAMLERWKDPELRLVAQVALAGSLLGVELHELNISISH